jgi:hypothetical protein
MTPRNRTRLIALEGRNHQVQLKVVYLLDGVYYDGCPYSGKGEVIPDGERMVEQWESEGFTVLVVKYVQEPYATE